MLRLARFLSSKSRWNITTHPSIKSRVDDPRWKGISLEREYDDVDVLIVGGGPAGLSTAIKLGQLSREQGKQMRICVLEKSSDFGQHMLSGACLEPRALDELLPDWKSMEGHPINTTITQDKLNYLTSSKCIGLPKPPWFPYSNVGNYSISLGKVAKWLSSVAESYGVELYSGIGASEVLYDESGKVVGVGTADSGIHKDGSPKENFERGLGLRAKVTVFAEGCHGSLSKEVINKYNLRANSCPQTYSIGLKELWLVDEKKHVKGRVDHNIGWPLDFKTYGGSFVYHIDDGPMVSLGLVISLSYSNTYLNPFQELQLYKTHPYMRDLLEGGKRIGYGARALNEGGYQAIPKVIFPGGCLVGCSAGFLNIAKLKGIHTAMKSGMIAAESIMKALGNEEKDILLTDYEDNLKKSWIYDELYSSRNIRPSFETNLGLYGMLGYTGVFWSIFKGKESTTLKWTKKDNEHLLPARDCQKKVYPKPDNKLTFDILSSVALTNTNHDHDEPAHLTLKNDDIPQDVNLKLYDGPEQRYCPAAVYEFVDAQNGNDRVLQINAQNCIHCKTCDIKDPTQNINWVVPQNGGGPGYSSM